MIDAPEASLTKTSQAYFLEVISNATLTAIMSNAPNKQRVCWICFRLGLKSLAQPRILYVPPDCGEA